MADRFYGIAAGGQKPADVTEAATTTSAVIELRVNDTAYNRKTVEIAVRALLNYLTTVETNPIA